MKTKILSNGWILFCAIALVSAVSGCKKSITTNDDSTISKVTNTTQHLLTKAATTGYFNFTLSGVSKTIKVHFYIPQGGDKTTMPILIILHGNERNADKYRDSSMTSAANKKFMVFAPEFSDSDFSDNAYALGNVYTNGNSPSASTLNDSTQWTYSYIEPLFDAIKSYTGSTKNTYKLYGYSAGGQFVHRYAMFINNTRFDTAVAGSSGWYTVANPTLKYPTSPYDNLKFPYNILNSPLEERLCSLYFAKHIFITVGRDDIYNNSNLRTNTEANLQGKIKYRLERSQYFYDQSKLYANSKNVQFNWHRREVPKAGHANQSRNLLYAIDSILFKY